MVSPFRLSICTIKKRPCFQERVHAMPSRFAFLSKDTLDCPLSPDTAAPKRLGRVLYSLSPAGCSLQSKRSAYYSFSALPCHYKRKLSDWQLFVPEGRFHFPINMRICDSIPELFNAGFQGGQSGIRGSHARFGFKQLSVSNNPEFPFGSRNTGID